MEGGSHSFKLYEGPTGPWLAHAGSDRQTQDGPFRDVKGHETRDPGLRGESLMQ